MKKAGVSNAHHKLTGNGGYMELPKELTLRDYFAAAALKGFCANHADAMQDFNPDWEGYKGGIPEEYAEAAKRAYLMADAMLTERDKAG